MYGRGHWAWIWAVCRTEVDIESEVQDKSTSTSSWSSIHQQKTESKTESQTYNQAANSQQHKRLFSLSQRWPDWHCVKFNTQSKTTTVNYNLSQVLNYFVLVLSVFCKTLVDRWSCNIESKRVSSKFPMRCVWRSKNTCNVCVFLFFFARHSLQGPSPFHKT